MFNRTSALASAFALAALLSAPAFAHGMTRHAMKRASTKHSAMMHHSIKHNSMKHGVVMHHSMGHLEKLTLLPSVAKSLEL